MSTLILRTHARKLGASDRHFHAEIVDRVHTIPSFRTIHRAFISARFLRRFRTRPPVNDVCALRDSLSTTLFLRRDVISTPAPEPYDDQMVLTAVCCGI